MLLKITKDMLLAQPEVWKPHWQFVEGQELQTDNEYLINRLIELKVAKIVDKTDKKTVQKKVSKTKQQLTLLNKMHDEITLNKKNGVPDLTKKGKTKITLNSKEE